MYENNEVLKLSELMQICLLTCFSLSLCVCLSRSIPLSLVHMCTARAPRIHAHTHTDIYIYMCTQMISPWFSCQVSYLHWQVSDISDQWLSVNDFDFKHGGPPCHTLTTCLNNPKNCFESFSQTFSFLQVFLKSVNNEIPETCGTNSQPQAVCVSCVESWPG